MSRLFSSADRPADVELCRLLSAALRRSLVSAFAVAASAVSLVAFSRPPASADERGDRDRPAVMTTEAPQR
jgi:hypothetical protein